MPVKVSALTDTIVRKLRHDTGRTGAKISTTRKVAYHAVGNPAGLLLQCRLSGARSWIVRTRVSGSDRRCDVGLGPYPDVSLADAREAAKAIIRDARRGVDPVAQRRQEKHQRQQATAKLVTFAELVPEYLKRKEGEFHEKSQRKQMQKVENQIRHILPRLGDMVVGEIRTPDVTAALVPIWGDKHDTAKGCRRHAEAIISMAKTKGIFEGDNPATYKAVTELLPAPKGKGRKKAVNQPALAVESMPAFFARLMQGDALGSRALAFQILTAARPGEVRHAQWEHVDFANKIWSIPPDDMKMGRAHDVPLSDAAAHILESLPRLGPYIFAGDGSKPISENTANVRIKAIHRADIAVGGAGFVDPESGRIATGHGMRSTFRDWAGDFTNYPRELAELALAHDVGDATEGAYARRKQREKRRPMMDAWAEYCAHGQVVEADNVVTIRRNGI